MNRFGIVMVALAALLLVSALGIGPRLVQQAPMAAAIGGPFTLTDQNGNNVTDQSFRGRVMVIYFGYSFCPDVCPTTLAELGRAINQLSPDLQTQIAPIFITIDPERDSVAQMAAYVGAFSPRLIGLTGSQAQIDAVVKGYHVYAKKSGQGTNYSMDHSSILYVMGRDGVFLRHLDGNAPATEIIAALKKALSGAR